MKKRIDYIDVARGLGIILVVIGHSGTPFRNLIYLFHMPLFYFLSGYFYKKEYSAHPLLFLKKRLKRLYIPFIKYGLIFLCLHNLFINIHLYKVELKYYNLITFFKSFINILTFQNTEQLLGSFWFFSSLFITEALFVFISFFTMKNITKRKELIRFLVVALCSCFGYLLSIYNIHLIRNIDISFSVLILFYLGYLYNQHKDKVKNNIYLFIFFLINLVILNYLGRIELSQNYYENPFYLIVCSLSGIYVILCISKFLCTHKFNITFIKYLGKNTIPIMALHFLVFKLVNLIQIIIYKYPLESLASFPTIPPYGWWWILYSILGIFVPCLFTTWLKKLTLTLKNYIHQKINA